MRSPFVGYARWFATATMTALPAIAAVNVVVDPFGVFRLVDLPALLAHREHHTRTAKAEELARGGCGVLLLGSSRCEVGFDLSHPVLVGRAPRNVGLAAITARETAAVFRFALVCNRPQDAVVFADALMFGGGPAYDFADSLFNPERTRLEYVSAALFGRVETSLRILSRAATGRTRPSDAPEGFSPEPDRRGGLTRKAFIRPLTFVNTQIRHPDSFAPVGPTVAAFAADCRRTGTRLTFVIGPLHAVLVESIYAAGRGDEYEAWTRSLVAAAAEQAQPGTPDIRVWDFTSYCGPAAEIPPAGTEVDERLRWFREASHFRRAFGDLVLERIFAARGATAPADAPGVLLTPANIDSHLERRRRERAEFRRRHADALREFGLP